MKCGHIKSEAHYCRMVSWATGPLPNPQSQIQYSKFETGTKQLSNHSLPRLGLGLDRVIRFVWFVDPSYDMPASRSKSQTNQRVMRTQQGLFLVYIINYRSQKSEKGKFEGRERERESTKRPHKKKSGPQLHGIGRSVKSGNGLSSILCH